MSHQAQRDFASYELENVPSESNKTLPFANVYGEPTQDARFLPDESQCRPKGWPSAPRPVKRSAAALVSELCVDTVLIVLSLLFFIFGLTVKHYDQVPTASIPRITALLVEVTKYVSLTGECAGDALTYRQGPSVFPILFACVVGRAAHAVLLWRLERGERIGVLDLLAGSTSLTSTVTS